VETDFVPAMSFPDSRSGLRNYCWDVSKIVQDYSGGWYSKAVWEKRLNLPEARKFTSYAIEKLLSEVVG